MIDFVMLCEMIGEDPLSPVIESLAPYALKCLAHIEAGRPVWVEGPEYRCLMVRMFVRAACHHLDLREDLLCSGGATVEIPMPEVRYDHLKNTMSLGPSLLVINRFDSRPDIELFPMGNSVGNIAYLDVRDVWGTNHRSYAVQADWSFTDENFGPAEKW